MMFRRLRDLRPAPFDILLLGLVIFLLVYTAASVVTAETRGVRPPLLSKAHSPALEARVRQGGEQYTTPRRVLSHFVSPATEAAVAQSAALQTEEVAQVTAPAAPPPPPPVYHSASLPEGTAAAPAVSARAFAIIDPGCGALLWGKNEHERLPPASLTKMVTALVVAANANLDDVVSVEVSGSAMAARGSSVMGIEPGMQVSVRDLLYGLMLPSGNDAALALAAYVGAGDVGRFVEAMNQVVAGLRLENTHFTNPHGLDDPGLYSSAYDLALIGAELGRNPVLAEISSARAHQLPGGLAFQNGNKLLNSYFGSYGVKIGYTRHADQTIVAGAQRDGRNIMVAVLGSSDRYQDAAALLDWGFANTPPVCQG